MIYSSSCTRLIWSPDRYLANKPASLHYKYENELQAKIAMMALSAVDNEEVDKASTINNKRQLNNVGATDAKAEYTVFTRHEEHKVRNNLSGFIDKAVAIKLVGNSRGQASRRCLARQYLQPHFISFTSTNIANKDCNHSLEYKLYSREWLYENLLYCITKSLNIRANDLLPPSRRT